MLRISLSTALALLLAAGLTHGQERKVDTAAVDDEFRHAASADAVILNLVDQLGKSESEARDAAAKLAQVGKPAVSVLTDLLTRGPSPQVKYYAAVALSRIRHASATKALLPMLTDKDASREMRLLAISSAAGCNLDEVTAPLAAMAESGDDDELRLKALQALSVMPTAWRDCENLFARLLTDPNEEIRLMGAQVCFYAAAVKMVYGAAEPKLLELAEKDSSTTLQCRCLRALARMKSGRAVALSVRLLAEPTTGREVSRQALSAIQTITEVPVQDAAAVQRWWEKHGNARYAHAPALPPFTVQGAKDKEGASNGQEPTPSGERPGTQPAAKTASSATATPEPDSTAPAVLVPLPPATTNATTIQPPAPKPPSTPPAAGNRRPVLDDGVGSSAPLKGVPIR